MSLGLFLEKEFLSFFVFSKTDRFTTDFSVGRFYFVCFSNELKEEQGLTRAVVHVDRYMIIDIF